MKKIVLFSMIVFLSSQSYALVTQGSWRWRNDDGNEKTATYMAGQNEAVTINSSSNPVRLRIGLYNVQNQASDVATSVLQYATSSSGPWDTIKTVAGTRAFVLAGTDAYVKDGEATTNQLTMAYPFFPGKMVVSSVQMTSNKVPVKNATEYEWVLLPTPNLKPSTTYYFRFTPVDSYPEPLPSLMTAAVLPVHFVSFVVENDQGIVKLKWQTGSEQNADQFAIERSTNGRDGWQTISTVKAKGNTSETNLYVAYDNKPLPGNSFYRLKETDIDGNLMYSQVRTIIMSTGVSLKVFPNPSKGQLFFTLAGFTGNAQLQVIDMNGKMILQQQIQVDGSNKSYPFELKNNIAKGLYNVTLKGNGLNEKAQIMIE